MKARYFIVLWVMLMVCNMTFAHDFVVTLNGQKVYFNIQSKQKQTAEVTYCGSIADKQPTYYEGELTIPAKVKHDNVVYSVVGITAKAFSGADKLTGIILPMGLTTIGDFAFEGCTSLSKIIFPGNTMKFGEGVFFKCDKIADISFGSDWKNIDLKMFRWSDSLSVVTIPAKVERIQSLKSLAKLERVYVDVNNANFSAIEGILYNKSNEVLYGCPRAYQGDVKVADGTKRITTGAFIDCKDITRVDLPESLQQMSFREFSRMADLNEIIFRGVAPIHTATKDSEPVFLLQVMNPDLKIIVLKRAKNAYKETLVQTSGEYLELNNQTPFFVEKDDMPQTKNIIGVKNFSKYE